MARRPLKRLTLFRCDRCGETLFGPPNGVKAGDICNVPIPPEYVGPWYRRKVIRECPGIFEKLGVLAP